MYDGNKQNNREKICKRKTTVLFEADLSVSRLLGSLQPRWSVVKAVRYGPLGILALVTLPVQEKRYVMPEVAKFAKSSDWHLKTILPKPMYKQKQMMDL